MADDKGGGGASSWEPFEIIIVVLLIGGLLMKWSEPAVTTPPKTSPKTATIQKPPATPAESCGLTTMRPHALEKVSSFVTISGTITGCNWVPTDTVALYAQVIDSTGKPVSEYTAVPPGAIQGSVVPFDASVQLTGQPTSGKGYLILIPATQTGSQSITARIPITFSAN